MAETEKGFRKDCANSLVQVCKKIKFNGSMFNGYPFRISFKKGAVRERLD